MERVAVSAVEAVAREGVRRRRLGDALGTSDVAVNHYHVEPGARIAGLHAHADQAEVFVVLEGEAVFETLDGRVLVGAGETIRFPAGEFQSCTNPAGATEDGTPVVVLAVGAPADSDDVRVAVRCSACGHDEQRLQFDAGSELLVCLDCGAESAPSCGECGGERVRVVLDDEDRPAEECLECGAHTPAR